MHAEQLVTVMSTIAETLLSVPLRRAEGELYFGDDAVFASVGYEGSFHGALSVTCDAPLACALTRLMIGDDRRTWSHAYVFDALGEIANIAAGNLRGLLAADCQLGLPKVSLLTAAREPAQPLLASASLMMLEQPLLVKLRGINV